MPVLFTVEGGSRQLYCRKDQLLRRPLAGLEAAAIRAAAFLAAAFEASAALARTIFDVTARRGAALAATAFEGTALRGAALKAAFEEAAALAETTFDGAALRGDALERTLEAAAGLTATPVSAAALRVAALEEAVFRRTAFRGASSAKAMPPIGFVAVFLFPLVGRPTAAAVETMGAANFVILAGTAVGAADLDAGLLRATGRPVAVPALNPFIAAPSAAASAAFLGRPRALPELFGSLDPAAGAAGSGAGPAGVDDFLLLLRDLFELFVPFLATAWLPLRDFPLHRRQDFSEQRAAGRFSADAAAFLESSHDFSASAASTTALAARVVLWVERPARFPDFARLFCAPLALDLPRDFDTAAARPDLDFDAAPLRAVFADDRGAAFDVFPVFPACVDVEDLPVRWLYAARIRS